MTEPRQLFTRVPIDAVRPNPNNPRLIKDERFRKLVKSVADFPEMLELRPIVVDADGMILAGNQRWNAAKTLGMKEVPVIYARELTEDQKREFLIKDNVHAGDFAWASFFDQGDQYDVHELADWGLDLPFLPKEQPGTNREGVTESQVSAAEERLNNQYGERAGLKQVTCPHCGEDFHIDP
ncbi:MAG: ParB N-terminal domain-containing protein [Burkholderiales bacterium]|nr:ParB N-terminal domain-containing protein [Burkholderiales bacterium]